MTASSVRAHVVQFYDRPVDLIEAVGPHIAETIATSGSVIVIATPAHRADLEDWLSAHDVDWQTATAERRYLALDANAAMAQFIVGGRPDPIRFRAVIGSYVDAMISPVFAFGEMVSILWENGNVAGAIELESMWTEFVEQHSIARYCAYRAATFANSDDLAAVSHVCGAHTTLIPPASYALSELPTVAPAAQAQMFLPVPEAILGVRRFVAGALAMSYAQPFIADALLVASELATNAVRHTGGPFRAMVTPSEEGVRLEFHDTSPATPRTRPASTSEVDGRGLAIVERLAAAWGVEERAGGKVVWADLS